MKNLEDLEELLYWMVMTAAVVLVGKAILDVMQ